MNTSAHLVGGGKCEYVVKVSVRMISLLITHVSHVTLIARERSRKSLHSKA
jgi:hypothetical protein